MTTWFLPRDLHPGAWWVWALGLATATSRTTNPWLLGAVIAVLCLVVVSRRADAPWALSFRLYVWLAVVIVAMRVGFRIIFGGGEGSTILFTLPEIPLPAWAAGIRLFGAVSAESLVGGFLDGLRLATMVLCLGAANALANPKRLLKALPPALYEIGTAVVVALSVAPQLAESVVRVHRARRLRGHTGVGRHAVRSIVIPVLEDALDKSLALAASMDSRGYGRAGTASTRSRAVTGGFLMAGLVGLGVGSYGILDATTPAWLGGPMLAGGAALGALGFALAGRRVQRTRYRPDRWQGADLVAAGSGIAAAVGLVWVLAAQTNALNPTPGVLAWPLLSWGPLAAVLLGALPAWLTPPPADTVQERSPELVAA